MITKVPKVIKLDYPSEFALILTDFLGSSKALFLTLAKVKKIRKIQAKRPH